MIYGIATDQPCPHKIESWIRHWPNGRAREFQLAFHQLIFVANFLPFSPRTDCKGFFQLRFRYAVTTRQFRSYDSDTFAGRGNRCPRIAGRDGRYTTLTAFGRFVFDRISVLFERIPCTARGRTRRAEHDNVSADFVHDSSRDGRADQTRYDNFW